MEPQNSVVLSGQITKTYDTRTTPYGIAIVSFILEHSSNIVEIGEKRSVKCRIYCVMMGTNFSNDDLNDKHVTLYGFLGQNSKAQLVLHVNKINIFG